MAKTSVVSMSLNATGDGINMSFAPAQVSNQGSPALHEPVALSSGANTIQVPAGTQYVFIVPPTNSTIAKTLKGVTGDTGILLGNANPSMFALASGQTSFVLNAAGSETIEIYFV